MKKTAWSHLPNAVHIDRVLASVKAHPDVWDAARSTARSTARFAARDAARSAARDAARDAAWSTARFAARDAVTALTAWDNSALYLDMPGDQLEVWYHLSEQPACLLLLPAVRAFEQIEELELA